MNIEVSCKNLQFLEAFSSETRIKIIEMLNIKQMNIKDMAAELEISSAIVTKHIQKLKHAGIVKCESTSGKRGMQKVCYLNLEQATLIFKPKQRLGNYYFHSIPVGQYSSCSVKPTCGLASESGVIGILDDPRYFNDPEHIKASILWFGSGWVEYRVPNYLLSNQKVTGIEVSLEICSEAPGFNENWPSDITFYLNSIEIGMWTSPGDFGKVKGVFTPDWWTRRTEYGLLKTITINENGSFIDGVKVSEVKISMLNITYGKEIIFRVASLESSRNVGGVTLLGKNFGNYNQDINIAIEH